MDRLCSVMPRNLSVASLNWSVLIGVLIVGFFFALWLRDRAWKSLHSSVGQIMRDSAVREEWIATYEALLSSIARKRRAALIGKVLDQLPEVHRIKFKHYVRMHRLADGILAAIAVCALISSCT